MTFNNATNNFGVAKWIVDSTSGQGTHTTIAAAISSASSGQTIFLRPGTYTENITLKAGVNLTSFSSDGLVPCQGGSVTPNVTIQGTVTATYSGSCTISGIQLQTNSATALSMTGSNATQLTLVNCSVYANNSTGFTLNNSSSTVSFYYCTFISSSTNNLYTATATGGIDFENCTFGLSATATASTIALGRAVYEACDMPGMNVTTSSIGGILVNGCNWLYGGQTLLTTAGTGTSEVYNSILNSTTASTISVGSGTTVNIANCSIGSSNTNVITGAGTIQYSSLTFTSTSSTINTTTQVAFPYKSGTLTVPGQGASFTPVLNFGGATTGITYSEQVGEYTQIGNIVYFYINIILSSKGSASGVATITGLPLTTNANANVIPLTYFSNITLTALYTNMSAYNNATSTTLNLIQSGSGQAATTVSNTNFANNSIVIMNGWYFTT